jgi:pimeloyl-ACP methyl ester carboxylesterase
MDLMGYGESDRPFEADYSLANQVEVLRAAMGSLRLRRVALAGVDLGGGVAVRLAATVPQAVSQLALINSAALADWPGDDVRRVQGRTAHNALRLARGVLGASALLGPVLRESVADPGHMPSRLVARYLAPYAGTEGVVHLLELARALDSGDLADVPLGAITAKTLVVHGAADRWLSLALSARLHAGIAGSGLVTVPNAARLVPEDAPGLMSDLLLTLLDVGDSGAMQGVWNDS